jgi:hypothetical protein
MRSENFKIQIYILGTLLKHGASHGYRLSQLLSKNECNLFRLKHNILTIK